MAKVIASRYRQREKIGGGSFGTVYRGEDIKSGHKVAIKIETQDCPVPQLYSESRIYSALSGCTNIPRHYLFSREKTFQAMVIDLEGPSIEDMLKKCGGRLSLKTVLMLADQMLLSLQYIHQKGFIHRDIKPENFVLGLETKENQVYLIDFGLAKSYRLPDGSHIQYHEHRPMTGTARYASISTLSGGEQSRRDDLEALAYILVYLMKGVLPWQSVRAPTPQIKYDKILAIKKVTPASQLCEELPNEFAIFLNLTKNLKFNEEPEYARYRRLFRDLFERMKFVFDYHYEWTKVEPKHRALNSSIGSARREMKNSYLLQDSPSRKARSPSKNMHKKPLIREKVVERSFSPQNKNSSNKIIKESKDNRRNAKENIETEATKPNELNININVNSNTTNNNGIKNINTCSKKPLRGSSAMEDRLKKAKAYGIPSFSPITKTSRTNLSRLRK